MMLFEKINTTEYLSDLELKNGISTALAALGTVTKMLIVPPDITRLHSEAGKLTRFAYDFNPSAISAIMPALGTHVAMNEEELSRMFGDIPKKLFKVHDWRNDCVNLGAIKRDFVKEVSQGAVDYDIPVEVNRILVEQKHDCILSIGQIVPHEVAGMAGHAKNIFVGLGGAQNIHKSHFLGAAFGIEKILGKTDSPVRKVFDYAMETYLGSLPIVHALTVIGRDKTGKLRVAGLFIGTGKECFLHAAELSRAINFEQVPTPLSTVVTYLDPVEYKSFWLGNKSIYRTRMAIADNGRLIVIAPGLKAFGEDAQIDSLIRKYGYKGTPYVMDCIRKNDDLKSNLSAAAHLIHGSTEGRFTVTYCVSHMSKHDVENAGFEYASAEDMLKRYDPSALTPGTNILADGEEIYFIPNPATGLWAYEGRIS